MIQSNSARPPESPTVRHSVGRVVRDVLTLVELQGQLLKSDACEFTEQSVRPVALFAAGSLLLLATVPVCLLAIAEGLVAAGVWRGLAYGLVALASVALAAGMTAWAWGRLRGMPPLFARSRQELAENIALIKDSLKDRPFPVTHRPEEYHHDRFHQHPS